MTVAHTAQMEFLIVDPSLKEYSAFVSLHQNEGQFKLFANSSSPDTDPMSMELGMVQSEDDTYQVSVLAKIMYPDVWLDAKVTLEDDDLGGFTFIGHLEAPGTDLIYRQSHIFLIVYKHNLLVNKCKYGNFLSFIDTLITPCRCIGHLSKVRENKV